MPFSINDYSSLEKTGPAGEPGRVYSAIQQSQNRKVALKKIPLSTPIDFTLATSLKREILSSGVLDHPNIIRIYDFGEDRGSFYIVMEYVNGYSLDDILFWRPFSREITLVIMLHALRGIWFAHKKNIAHCNIKPANILISQTGKVVLTDFGLSNSMINSVQHHTLKRPARSVSSYMPPEQTADVRDHLLMLMQATEDIPVFSDQKLASLNYTPGLDFKKDIWSTGAILYQVLTGSLPFSGGNKTGPEQSTLDEKGEVLSSMLPLFPGDLVAAINSCLIKDPGKRADSLEPLILALQNYLNDFGLQKSTNELRQYLTDKTAFNGEVEKKATDYHIRKGNELLAQGNIRKSNAHFDAAKAIVFDPSKNNHPITLFPGEAQDESDDLHTEATLPGTIANMATVAQKIVRPKILLRIAGALAALLAMIILLPLIINSIKHLGLKNEAFQADVPETWPRGKNKNPVTTKSEISLSKHYPLPQNYQTPPIAPSAGDSPWNKTTTSTPGSGAADFSPVDSGSLKKTNDSPQTGVSSFGTLIASIEPLTAYIFIDKAGVPREELTVGKYLRAGPHSISALANGYLSYKDEFLIEKDATLKLSIVLKKTASANGSLHVYSKPAAELYIDGSFQGSAPTLSLIMLPGGDHTLQLRRNGYKTHVETISIEAGEEKRLQIELEKE